jgi:hypothetical protein
MPDRLAPVPMIFAEFAPLDRTDDFKVIGVEMGDHLSTGSDPVNGFQGLRVRLSFKPKPLTGPDSIDLPDLTPSTSPLILQAETAYRT